MTGVQTCALPDRKSTRLNSSHTIISYAVFFLKKKDKFYQLADIGCRAVRFRSLAYLSRFFFPAHSTALVRHCTPSGGFFFYVGGPPRHFQFSPPRAFAS